MALLHKGCSRIVLFAVTSICTVCLPILNRESFFNFLLDDLRYSFDNTASASTSSLSSIKSFDSILWTSENKAQSVDIAMKSITNVFPDARWLEEYIRWHNDIREAFPDIQLWTNSSAPDVVVYYNCGKAGLNDRVRGLENSIRHAYDEKKVLLLKWFTDFDLPNFLSPNLINWTCPHFNETLFDPCSSKQRQKRPFSISIKSNDHSTHGGNRIEFHGKHFREGDRNVTNSSMFRMCWHALFKPSPVLQTALVREASRLSLEPGQYHATHCRVRHPAHFKSRKQVEEDFNGANFTGKQRVHAINTAIRAIKCTAKISQSRSFDLRTEPIYFFSDAEQLVHSVIRLESSKDSLESGLHDLSLEKKVVGRFSENTREHITRKNGTLESYLDTFIDLFIAANARCVTVGVGGFGRLAAKISGTRCVATHEKVPPKIERKWGYSGDGIPVCHRKL